MVIAIVNFGLGLKEESVDEWKGYSRARGVLKPESATDGSEFFQEYVITSDSETIAINEYACRLANLSTSTHVIQFDDLFGYEPDSFDQEFHELVLQERPG